MIDLSAPISWLVEQIVKLAVQRLPLSARERYEEEWLAHINEVPSIFMKLYAALGMFFGAGEIAKILTLGEGIGASVASQLRQSNLYRGPSRIEPKIELNIKWENASFLYPLLFRHRPPLSFEIEHPKLPKVNKEELLRNLKEVELKFPLRFLGRLPRGAAAHVFDDDAIDLLAEKREGLSLLDLAGAELDLAERLGRPVGIVLKSALRGDDRQLLLAQTQPI